MSQRLLPVIVTGLALAACGGRSSCIYESPLESSAVYRIGVADVIGVTVKDNPSFSVTGAQVRTDGNITLPLIDDIPVVGKTPAEAKDSIVRKLGSFIKAPLVTVTLEQLQSYQWFAIGNVRAPNRYDSNRLVTVLQALAMAGGLTEFADPSGIIVVRQTDEGQQCIAFDYATVADGTALGQNIVLRTGDTVIVP